MIHVLSCYVTFDTFLLAIVVTVALLNSPSLCFRIILGLIFL